MGSREDANLGAFFNDIRGLWKRKWQLLFRASGDRAFAVAQSAVLLRCASYSKGVSGLDNLLPTPPL